MPPPNISEIGSPKDGQPQHLDRRLFMQLLAFGRCLDSHRIINALVHAGIQGVIYEDINDAHGIALLTFSEDPDFFITKLRPLLHREPFAGLPRKPELTMFGRTYAIGYEPDLVETLFTRPRSTALNPDWPWAIWYPLRRSGAFLQLPPDQQRAILMEHGTIGRSFGEADYAHDIRLACHGLDQSDNDFVVGLLGRHLHPLSAIVQTMRKTKQTSQYIQNLGPFFIGKAVWQSPNPS